MNIRLAHICLKMEKKKNQHSRLAMTRGCFITIKSSFIGSRRLRRVRVVLYWLLRYGRQSLGRHVRRHVVEG